MDNEEDVDKRSGRFDLSEDMSKKRSASTMDDDIIKLENLELNEGSSTSVSRRKIVSKDEESEEDDSTVDNVSNPSIGPFRRVNRKKGIYNDVVDGSTSNSGGNPSNIQSDTNPQSDNGSRHLRRSTRLTRVNYKK